MVACKVRNWLSLPLLLIAWLHVNGQAVDLSKPIRLHSSFTSLDSGLRAASQQAGVVFSYNSKKLNTRQAVNFGQVTTLAQFLSQLEKVGLKIKIIENYIVLSPQAEKKLTVKETVASPPSRKVDRQATAAIPGDGAVSTTEDEKSLVDKTILWKTNIDLLPQVHSLPKMHEPKLQGLIIGHVLTTKKAFVQAPRLTPTISKAPKALSYFARYGLSADETTPLGIAAQVGFPYLFGSISVNTSFESSQFRYGLGTSVKINQGTRLLLVFSLGNVERSGQFTDSTVTTYPIAVKSKLSRLAASIEFSLSKRVKLQTGPMFNYLQTNYFINSQASSLQLFKSAGDHLFYAIKPPYVLTNTFSPTTNSNLKTWIGFQVNLFYTLIF